MLLLMLLLATEPKPKKPEQIGIAVSTRYSLGHLCPVSTTLALTASHIIDPAPLKNDVPLIDLRYFDSKNQPQIGTSLGILPAVDAGLVHGQFESFYSIATSPPKEGDIVYSEGFNWNQSNKHMRKKIYEGRIVELNGGKFSFDRNSQPGSSGSCVLNDKLEIVGIEVWGLENTGIAEATWGWTLEYLEGVATKITGRSP